MEKYLLLFITMPILLAILFKYLLSSPNTKLPPGPPPFRQFSWLGKSLLEIEDILKHLKHKYGPILTIKMGFRTAIFITSPSLAHRALVQNGAVFSNRPVGLPANTHNISSSSYGPTWRLLRRNLTSEILHPSKYTSYSHARRRVISILLQRLLLESRTIGVVEAMSHFQYTMCRLLIVMCFGEQIEENQINSIEKVQRDFVLSSRRFDILNVWPTLGKLLFFQRWKEFFHLCKRREDVFIPIIKTRLLEKSNDGVVAYVDTLHNLKVTDRKLTCEEMVSLCGEFLNAGSDTSATALEWIMANLTKYPVIQDKLYEEIVGVVGPNKRPSSLIGRGEEEVVVVVEEEELQRMPYLKAVVLETLRLYPPTHFAIPHSVAKDVELDGYVISKDTIVNFMIAEIGRDSEVWSDPMEFKPERFLTSNGGEKFDITGSREIKMMPFGAGRRICPGLGLALLHLEFFVANLVWYFEWKSSKVDLSEKIVFTVVMKNSLLAHISPRAHRS